jgi:hypothetical protein
MSARRAVWSPAEDKILLDVFESATYGESERRTATNALAAGKLLRHGSVNSLTARYHKIRPPRADPVTHEPAYLERPRRLVPSGPPLARPVWFDDRVAMERRLVAGR